MSDSVRPLRRQPTRLLCLWDSPGKNTGVGCHFLLQCMKVKSESEVAQSCLILRNPMDCSLPGSSTHGIFQTRVLEWLAVQNQGLAFLETSRRGFLFFFFFLPLPVSGSSGCLVAFGILTAISICIFMWPTSLYISVSLQRCRDGACGAHLLVSLLSCEDTSPIGIVTTLEQYNLILITFSNTLFLHKVTSTGSGVGLQHIS